MAGLRAWGEVVVVVVVLVVVVVVVGGDRKPNFNSSIALCWSVGNVVRWSAMCKNFLSHCISAHHIAIVKRDRKNNNNNKGY